MTDRIIRPEYLVNNDGKSNKFYVICETVDGKEAYTGWGPNKPNEYGQWKKISTADATRKITDKTRNGYKVADFSEIPPKAIDKLHKFLSEHAPGRTLEKDGSGNFILRKQGTGNGSSSPARSPKSAISRDRIEKKYHIWI